MRQPLFIATALLLMTLPAAAQAPATPADVVAATNAASGNAAPGAAPVTAPVTAATPAAPGTPAAAAPAAAGDAAAGAVAGAAAAPDPNIPPPEPAQPLKDPFTRSLFFSQADLVDIKNALNGITSTGPLGEATEKPIPPVRTIVITGMNYFSPDNWIVWLNGQKITPYIRMPEIQEIDVRPGVVHLKWFDIGANKTLRLSMRPNEVYDIVTGVTLPDQTQVGP